MNSAQSDGDDIFFTAADGTTKLSHEIESYSNGALIAWVNVTTLSSVSDTVLYMYYGDPYSPSQANPTGVWDSNYKGVWHLDEGGNGTRYDSTGNHNDLNPRNYTGTEATYGKITLTDYLHNGTPPKDWLESANNIGITGNAVRTITFWSNLNTTLRCGMVGWGTSANNNEFSAGVRVYSYFLWGYANDWGPIATPLTGSWNYHAVIYDGTTARWYINGSQLGSGFTHSYSTADSHVFLGHEEDSGSWNTWMQGAIEEVRISSTARSLQWIQTEYTNQNSPSTFYSLAGEEAATCAPPPVPPSNPPTPQTPNPPWFSDCAWTYRKNITIDKAKVVGTQNSFPVLINITSDPDLKAHARSNGYDIFFTDTSNPPNQMPYERENYDPTTGALTAWVKVPQIQSSANTTLYMYYGYPSSPDMSATASVWDNGYVGVWHLNNSYADSTSNGHNGINYGTTPIAGKIGGGMNFNGASYINSTVTDLNTTNTFTISTWFKSANTTFPHHLIWEGNVTADGWGETWQTCQTEMHISMGDFANPTGTSGKLDFFLGDSDIARVGNAVLDANTSFTDTSTWNYVAVNVTGLGSSPSATLYLNGTAVGTVTGTVSRTNRWNWTTLWFGRAGRPAGPRYFSGQLDEIRVSTPARSPGWLTTEYASQNSSSTFAYIGPEEDYFCGVSGPAYVQSESQSFISKQQARITLPGSSISGDLLVLSFTYDQSLGISPSVTDSKNNTYYATVSTNVGGWGRAQTWYAKNITGGPGPVTAIVTLSGTASSVFDVFLSEYSGVSTSAPVQSTSNSDTSGTKMNTSSLTITSAPSLLYGFGADVSPGHSCQVNSPYTNRENTDGQCSADQTVLFTGPFNVTATQSSNGAWALQMLTFNGA
jgi:hypothetical protein